MDRAPHPESLARAYEGLYCVAMHQKRIFPGRILQDERDPDVTYISIVRLAADDESPAHFAVLYADSEEGLLIAAEVLGTSIIGLANELEDNERLRDLRLEADRPTAADV